MTPKWTFLIMMIVFVLLPMMLNSYEFDRFGKKKPKMKRAPPGPKKPVTLNTEHLPTLSEILEELQLTSFFPQFIKIGVAETHFLLRLTSMDYRIMLMDWEGITEEQVNRLKEKAASLYLKAVVEDAPPPPNYDERNKLKYGRFYLPGSVQSFEYVTGSFGGAPPIGAYEMVLAPTPHFGCNASDYASGAGYSNKLVVVKRGECSFLTKALVAKQLNASALIIANNEDRLDSPASGLGIDPNITDKVVDPVSTLSVISVANASWAKLAFSTKFAAPGVPVVGHIVPLKCGPGGICKPTLEEERALQAEITWGTARFKSAESKEVKTFEFLTSNYGGRLPDDHESLPVLLGSPIDGCEPLQGVQETGLYAIAFVRGGCRFHIKQQHAEAAGARVVIIFENETEDNALQRIGGMMPDAGFVGIPSVIVCAPAGIFLQSKLAREEVTVSLTAALDGAGADKWIDLAFSEWAETDRERLMQIEGLSQKHAQAGNAEIVEWLKRKADAIVSKSKTRVEL